jgi:DNA-binding NtrC family response regulator
VILSGNGRPVTAAGLGLLEPLTSGSSAAPFDMQPSFEDDEIQEPAADALDVAPNGAVLRLDEIEKQAIHAALNQTGGNRTQAAALLGISIRTLRNKLQEYKATGTGVSILPEE